MHTPGKWVDCWRYIISHTFPSSDPARQFHFISCQNKIKSTDQFRRISAEIIRRIFHSFLHQANDLHGILFISGHKKDTHLDKLPVIFQVLLRLLFAFQHSKTEVILRFLEISAEKLCFRPEKLRKPIAVPVRQAIIYRHLTFNIIFHIAESPFFLPYQIKQGRGAYEDIIMLSNHRSRLLKPLPCFAVLFHHPVAVINVLYRLHHRQFPVKLPIFFQRKPLFLSKTRQILTNLIKILFSSCHQRNSGKRQVGFPTAYFYFRRNKFQSPPELLCCFMIQSFSQIKSIHGKLKNPFRLFRQIIKMYGNSPVFIKDCAFCGHQIPFFFLFFCKDGKFLFQKILKRRKKLPFPLMIPHLKKSCMRPQKVLHFLCGNICKNTAGS